MKYTVIDDRMYEITSCNSCPFFDEDVGCLPECRHPLNDPALRLSMETCYGGIDAKCPLREADE